MTTQPDPTIRERLRELAEKATPGPWDTEPLTGASGMGQVIAGRFNRVGDGMAGYNVVASPVYSKPDAALIVEAVNALPALLTELDTLERRVRAAAGSTIPDRSLDVERLQFVQRIKSESGGADHWEAVSTDNPARRVAARTFDEAIRALAARLAEAPVTGEGQ